MAANIIMQDTLPKKIFGAELTEQDMNNLSMGKFTDKKEFFIRGEHKAGKVKFEDGKLQFLWERKELEIPNKILNKKLKPEEKEQLEKGFEIDLDKKTSISLDKKLNSVIIHSKHAGEKPLNKIGEYKLTISDKKQLSTGKNLDTKVFRGQYGYFLANVRLSGDGKGVEFSNIKGLKPQEVSQYTDKYNQPPTAREAPQEKESIHQEPRAETQQKTTLTQAIKDNHYDKIHELVKNGTEVKQSHIDLAKNGKSQLEEIACLTSMGIENPREITEKKVIKEEKPFSPASETKKGHSAEKAAHHAKGLLDTGFNNM